jgi:hypothetical protein
MLLIFREIIVVVSHRKPTNTLSGKNAKILNIQVGGTFKVIAL